VTVYLAAVRAALADLPAEERDDLLADVRPSLVEAAAEGGGSLAARLGPPEEFAAELRAAAGLAAPEREPSRRRDLVGALRRLAVDPRLRRLAPLWWMARGYVAVAAIALAVGAGWTLTYPFVPRFGSGAFGIVAIAAVVAVSVWLGLAGRSHRVAELVLVLAAVPVLIHLAHRPVPPSKLVYVELTSAAPGLTYDGVQLNNVYPYSRAGRLLHDVLLYTPNGDPIDLGPGVPDPQRRTLLTPLGKPVYNAFPIRYFDPGTRRVAHPDASPRVRIPRIATPALTRR
jgi:hypothetical protein